MGGETPALRLQMAQPEAAFRLRHPGCTPFKSLTSDPAIYRIDGEGYRVLHERVIRGGKHALEPVSRVLPELHQPQEIRLAQK